MKYGLIGEHLGHSYSKEIHEQFADYTYELQELEPSQLEAFLQHPEFAAINVTIPYKQAVIPYLAEISEQANEIGAVNTIVNENGRLCGYNTDFAGMQALIQYLGLSLSGKKVLICGTGGTSRTARAVAKALQADEVCRLSRNPKGEEDVISYEEALQHHTDAQIIINTTPSGMYPNQDSCPIPLEDFVQLEGAIDAVYNPLRTNFVLDAQRKGVPAAGGLYMLAAQAVYACGHFLNREMPLTDIDRAYQKVLREKQNIVLCGMPTSGKTSVAQQLQEMLQKQVLDTDELVKERIGMEISDYFALHGEQAFRDIESAVIKEIASEHGMILATGGGAVLRPENVRALKQNGVLVFLDRPLEKLIAASDRPLSADREALEKRFAERYDIYCDCADVRVDASGTIEENAKGVLAAVDAWNAGRTE